MSQFAKHMYINYDEDTLRQLVEHGASAGFAGMIYRADCVLLYETHEEEIWTALREDAEDLGYDSALEFIAAFNGAGLVDDADGFKNLLLWYMAERTAQLLVDEFDSVAEEVA